MSQVRATIIEALKEIQEQQGYRVVEPKNEHKVVKELGFSSLDVAQLIAVLEMDLGVDPFAQGVSIMDVVTVEDLIRVYQDAQRITTLQ